MDMLCLMFECPIRGVLASGGGEPWLDQEIAEAIGGPIGTNLECITELLAKGVAKRNDRNAIFSRRMVRDEQARQATKQRVQQHRRGVNVTQVVTPLKRPCTEGEDEEQFGFDFGSKSANSEFPGEELSKLSIHELTLTLLRQLEVFSEGRSILIAAVESALEHKAKQEGFTLPKAFLHVLERATAYKNFCVGRAVNKSWENWFSDRDYDKRQEVWSGKGNQRITEQDSRAGTRLAVAAGVAKVFRGKDAVGDEHVPDGAAPDRGNTS